MAESRRRRLSAIVAAAIALLGAAVLVASRDLQYWTPLGPGPGFFPSWMGGLLAVTGALWLFQVLRGGSATERETHAGAEPSAADPDESIPDYSVKTVLAIVVSIAVLAAVLEILGYQLSMLLFLLFHLLVLGRRGVLLSGVIAVIGSFGVFIVFTQFFNVALPASSIPFLRDLGL